MRMTVNPITLSPDNGIFEALELMKKYRISGVPITQDGGKEGRLVGILTNRDLRFETKLDRPISEMMRRYRISGVPITQDGGKEGRLVGILTNRDLRFETNLDRPIAEIMTRDPLFTVPVGTTLEQAREILHRHKVEKLLVVDDRFMLKGLITEIGRAS